MVIRRKIELGTKQKLAVEEKGRERERESGARVVISSDGGFGILLFRKRQT